MSKMSELDILVQEFNECKEERDRAEEEAMSCQSRMDEIREELTSLGFEKVLSNSSLHEYEEG